MLAPSEINSSLVIQTKLHQPSPQPDLVSRLSLVEKINEGFHRNHKLTLISAQAGSGKTTLAAEWCQQCDHPTTWFSLDQSDNDHVRFLQYFISALQKLGLEISQIANQFFHTSHPINLEPLLARIINEINQTLGPFSMILDDYHVIETPEIHETISFILDHAPSHMHMVIITRSDPPLPIARLRGRGQLTEIRVADLRFRSREIKKFLNEMMGLMLSDKQVAALETRTEGWIAGLQMAALSMQGYKDKSAFIRSFSGSHRYILDYLMEEVLKQQPVAIQEFLFKTSILERMTASLCDALTGRDDSHSVLGQLDKANLFMIPLDEERRWYRYHHLFADLLQQRLRQEQRYSAQDLHRQASEWCEKNGLIPDAMHHSLKAKDYERAAKRIEQAGWVIFTRGEMAAVIRWITALPQDILSSHPQLSVLCAWAKAKSGHLNEVEPCLQGVDAQTVQGEIAAVRAYVAGVRGNLSQAIELARTALANLPDENLPIRAIVTQNLGVAYHWSGDPIAASQTLTKAAELTRLANQKFQTLTTLAILGRAYEMQGNLHKAVDIYQDAIDLASEANQQPVPFAGMAHVGMAGPLYEWNDLDGAMRNAKEGLKLSRMGGFVAYQIFGYALLAKIYAAQGDPNQANEMLQKAEWLGRDSEYDLVMALVTEMRIRMWIRQENLAAAEDWAQAHQADSIDDQDAAGEIEQILVAEVFAAQGKFDQALNLLSQLLNAAQAARRMESVLRILILQALIYQTQQKTDRALSVLERVLTFGESEGYLRILVDHGDPMAQLLRIAMARGIVPNYVARLLATFDEQTEGVSTTTQALVEPLSERETEVLRLIVAGLSNPEIAAELTIAESTVKTHINHIYGKLDVKTRTQAVAIAREREIL